MVAYASFGSLQLIALLRFATAKHPVTGVAVIDWSDGRIWIYMGFVVSITGAGVWGWISSRAAVGTS